jgi:hypothetical protein
MGVGLHPAVEPLLPLDRPQGNGLPLFPEFPEVPVYRSQGKLRDPGFEPLIDPLGPRVASNGPDEGKDGLTLPAVFSFGPSGIHIIIIIITITIVKTFFEIFTLWGDWESETGAPKNPPGKGPLSTT